MANRHLSRSVVMQTLFERDFSSRKKGELSEILSKNAEEFAPGMVDQSFMVDLLDGVLKKEKKLDEEIIFDSNRYLLDDIFIRSGH